MASRRHDPSTVLWSIAGTVGASLLLWLLYGTFTLWHDVDVLKQQAAFFHGSWPPNRRAMADEP